MLHPAWNADTQSGREVRAQYFDGGGVPQGREFRVNQANGRDNRAKLARGGKHTVVYGPDGQLVVVWHEGVSPPGGVRFTMLPAEYSRETVADCPCCNVGRCWPCFKGDVNDDCVVNGLDIQPFVDLLLGEQVCANAADICRADCDWSSVLDEGDIPSFVIQLLVASEPCRSEGGPRGVHDCNANGIPDANDIAYGTSQDCNHNFIPDECDVDGDPDGDGLVSKDDNANGVPDECEPDCNQNGIPDDKDIKDETSDDVNSNGIPDECEPDCNENTIPDAWDLAQSTSADCNLNGTPDECEPDCNENGVPDECDLANCQYDPWCDDCNANGIPDECDIAAEISLDADENGIPDECEGEGLLGGGEGMMQGEGMMDGDGVGGDGWDAPAFGGGYLDGWLGGPCAGLVPDQWYDDPVCAAAWGEFFDWSMQQTWGSASELTGTEQLQRMLAKLAELGLPNPWQP